MRRTGGALLAAVIIALSPLAVAGAVTSPTWTIRATIGTGTSAINDGDIAVSGPSDAWTTWTCGPCGSTTPAHANLMDHWNGKKWSAVTLPAALKYPADIVGMDASASDNLWVFTANGRVSVFNGHHWDTSKLPSWVERKIDGGAPGVATAVFSAKNVWAFSIDAESHPMLAGHFHNGHWHKVQLPMEPELADALSPTDIWLSGLVPGHSGRELARWNGKKWQVIAEPSGPSGTTLVTNGFAASGPSSVEVMGEAFSKSGTSSELLHWHKHWTHTEVPASVGLVNQLAIDGHGGYWLIATSGSIDSAHTAFVHRSGGKWHTYPIPAMTGFTSEPGVLASVPGSTAMWSIGYLVNGSTPERGAIFSYGQ
ncbi:MAG TPA: hypothetical protein VME70_07360 [Mycobacteriales bacterium]|nr:hypothetical protein [Mycobacteriales bacterium]